MHEEISIPELTEVVARLSALLGPRQGGVLPLEGGITNRNFRVNFGGDDYVVRLPGKDTSLLGIDREAERLATKRAAELGLGAQGGGDARDPVLPGHLLHREPGDDRAPSCASRGRSRRSPRGLRPFHESGLELPTDFYVLEIVQGYAEVVARARRRAAAGLRATPWRAAGKIVKAVRDHPEHAPVPCHNDLLAANFLHDGERIVIVDWEYAGMGDRFFDLGNFAVNNELDDADEERLLEAYFGEPPATAAAPR